MSPCKTCGCKVASDPVVKLAVVKVSGEPVVKPGVLVELNLGD